MNLFLLKHQIVSDLNKVRMILADDGWIQGRPCAVGDDDKVRFCLSGAIRYVVSDTTTYELVHSLTSVSNATPYSKTIGKLVRIVLNNEYQLKPTWQRSIEWFNDVKAKSVDDVLEVVDLAINVARSRSNLSFIWDWVLLQ